MITTAKQLRTLADRTGLDAFAEVLRDAAGMVERLEERVQELEQAPTSTAAQPVAYALFAENGNIRIWSQQPLEISGVVPLYVHSPSASVTQSKPPGDATPAATETEVLCEALTEARNWFEQQARAVSKACGSSYELHDLRVQRDALDAALARAAQPAAVPAGYVLVPVEPTREMLDAVVSTMDDSLLGDKAEQQYREDWAAMLAAAPKAAPAQPGAAYVELPEPAYQWTDGTRTLQQDVVSAIRDYAGSKPETGEDWESWFEAAFDLLGSRVSEIFVEHATRASRGQAPAPDAVAEPVAWLHDDPQRYDVIHAEVKDLLVKSRDAAGHLHRPLDKSAHYTIPLYTAPTTAVQGDALDAERLDFLQDTGSTIELLPGETGFYPMRFRVGGLYAATSRDVRVAIDAARAAKEGASDAS